MADQDPNALRERELAAWWKTIALRKRNAVHAHTAFSAGWDRAWSKCSEVAEVTIKELTAELEAAQRKASSVDCMRAEVKRVRLLLAERGTSLSQLRATVERVREVDKRVRALLDDTATPGWKILALLRDALSAAPAPAAPDVHIAVSPEAVDEVLECDALKARVDELTAELEAERSTSKALRHELSRDMSASGELQLDAARTELSQLRATVERVRKHIMAGQPGTALACITDSTTPVAAPAPAEPSGHEDGDCEYAESLIEQLDEALCTLLHSGDELGEHSPESHLALFHEQQRDRDAAPAPAAPDGWEAVYKQEHQLRREIGAERDALKARVEQLDICTKAERKVLDAMRAAKIYPFRRIAYFANARAEHAVCLAELARRQENPDA